MSEQMKPCPFCGEAKHVGVGYANGRVTNVMCDTDGCRGNSNEATYGTEAEAIAAWNRRAPIAGMVMVPVEPTGAMIDLGAQVIDPSGVFGLTWEECCERAQAVLRAVLVASTKEG